MTSSRTFKAGILGSSKVLIRLSGIVSAAFLARLLTQVDYAAYRQTILSFHLVEPFLVLGLSQALVYFIPRDRGNSRSILTGNLIILFIMGSIFFLGMWMGGNELLASRFNNPVLKRLLLIYSPYGILALPLTTIGGCLLACNRVKSLAIFEVISRVVGLVLVISFVLIWRNPTAAVAGIIVGTAIMFFPGLKLMYSAAAAGSWAPSRINMKAQLNFGIPLGLASLIGMISINLDKLLVSSFFSPEQFAIYVNGAVEVPLVGIITGSVVAILIPEFAESYKKGDYGIVIDLWQRAMIKCALIMFPLMFYLFLMAPEVMTVLFSSKYTESYIPFRIYLLLFPMRITNFGALLMAAGLSRLIMIRTIGALLINLILSYILINYIGYIGAAVGTLVTAYTWSVTYSLKKIGIVYHCNVIKLIPIKKLLQILFLSFFPAILIIVIRMLISERLPVIRVIACGMVYGILTAALFQIGGLVSIADMSRLISKRIGKWMK